MINNGFFNIKEISLMANHEVIKEELKKKLKSILKLEARISEKAEDINNGDVSPFFLSLLGYEIALFGKVAQSINTTFGMSFYEQVSVILAKSAGYSAESQYKLKGEINEPVSQYLDGLLESNDYVPDRKNEIKRITELVTPGKEIKHPDSTVDVYITTPEGVEYYIDITTVKPNKKEFRVMKRKLLRWTAMRLSINPNADVRTFIAIPYNPEAGNDPTNCEYGRWGGFYDRKDLLVGDELWKLVSNNKFNIMDIISVFTELGEAATTELHKVLEKQLVGLK